MQKGCIHYLFICSKINEMKSKSNKKSLVGPASHAGLAGLAGPASHAGHAGHAGP